MCPLDHLLQGARFADIARKDPAAPGEPAAVQNQHQGHQLEIQIVGVGYNQDGVVFVQNPDEPSGLAEKLSQTEWNISS